MRRGTAVLYGPIKFDRENAALNVGDQTGEYRRKQHMVHQAYMADMAERVQGETPGDWIRFEKVQNDSHDAAADHGKKNGQGGGSDATTPSGGTPSKVMHEADNKHVATTFSQYASLIKGNTEAREGMAALGNRMQSASMSLAKPPRTCAPCPRSTRPLLVFTRPRSPICTTATRPTSPRIRTGCTTPPV